MPAGAEGELTTVAAALLGLLQGVTEFLPVSSSGHLALAQHLGLAGKDGAPGALAFDVLLHLATVVVVLQAFGRDIRRIFTRERPVLLLLTVGTLPILIVGGLAGSAIVETIRSNPMLVGTMLLISGGMLALCDRKEPGEKTLSGFRLGGALIVGLAQTVAIAPGISRSGSTITASVLLGLSREEAVRFSFLLMVPAVCAAATYNIYKEPEAWEALPAGPAAAGFVCALISGAVALRLLKMLVVRRRLGVFAVYCALAGSAALVFFGLIR